MRVLTFNVRYDEPADGAHAWRHRRDLVVARLREHDPDLIGLQEPAAAQWEEIAARLPGYTPFGLLEDESGEPDPRGGFFKTSRFEPRASGAFWLSDTPSVPQSVTWPNDWGARACAWIQLRDRQTGRDLVFANTHFDTNPGSWLPSARVIDHELDSARAAAVVLVGDFNCPAGSDAHAYLCTRAAFRDTWLEAGHSDDGSLTYNGFNLHPQLPPEAAGNYRIDWILVRGALTCVSAAIDRRADSGLLASDHYPVVATLNWTND